MNYFEMKWRLSACRIQAGYSQAEVAEILGCSDKTIIISPGYNYDFSSPYFEVKCTV